MLIVRSFSSLEITVRVLKAPRTLLVELLGKVKKSLSAFWNKWMNRSMKTLIMSFDCHTPCLSISSFSHRKKVINTHLKQSDALGPHCIASFKIPPFRVELPWIIMESSTKQARLRTGIINIYLCRPCTRKISDQESCVGTFSIGTYDALL